MVKTKVVPILLLALSYKGALATTTATCDAFSIRAVD